MTFVSVICNHFKTASGIEILYPDYLFLQIIMELQNRQKLGLEFYHLPL